ncbi:MAG TPA: biopolymer transporter ExbD [Verrucomicrobia bacterium]|nr:biopolymer transporter ExbD [Verrucomicrobiota bacterium]
MEEAKFLEDEFEADIDLTPLIDVVFMLLLFFILAATFSAPVLKVALPSAATAERVEDDLSRLVLSIDADGRLYHLDAPVSIEDVPGLLAAGTEGAVELRVDRAAPFDAFVGVMDRLRAAGRSDVLITTKSE